MKCLCLTVALLILQPVYCQLLKKEGDIVVEVTSHTLAAGNQGTIASGPSTVFYFSKSGALLEKVHYARLPDGEPDYAEIYTYNKSGLPQKMVTLESDAGQKLKPVYETKYVYDRNGRLTDASVYNAGKKSVVKNVTHEYDSIGNNVKSLVEPDCYLEKEYTKSNAIEAIRQIHADTLKWESNFTYKDDFRTGTFSSRYNNGAPVINEEIKDNGQTLKRYTSSSSTDAKTKYYYDETGMLEKAEMYSYSADDGYVLQSYTTVKVSGNVDQKLVKKINDQIME